MLNKLTGYFSLDIGMDLGTANTLIYVPGHGVVLDEPSVVAVMDSSGGERRLLAVGHAAKQMLGRTPGDIYAVRPLKDGVIADFQAAEEMIKKFIQSVRTRFSMKNPRIVMAVPKGATPVERRAIKDAAASSGNGTVFLIEEPMAAAIGSLLPVTEAIGSMVVDIGGGTSEVAVTSLGGIVASRSLKVAGDILDKDILEYASQNLNLAIGDTTAEYIKKSIGVAHIPQNPKKVLEVRGRDLVTGLPKNVLVNEKQVGEGIAQSVDTICNVVQEVLEETPPELAGDIVENGIIITGGGSLLRGFARRLREATNVPVGLAENPTLCVARGAGRVLENLDKMPGIFVG